jgi:hypothetical protein
MLKTQLQLEFYAGGVINPVGMSAKAAEFSFTESGWIFSAK